MKKLVVITKKRNTNDLITKNYVLEEQPTITPLKTGSKCILVNTDYQNYPVIFLGFHRGLAIPVYLSWNQDTSKVELTHSVCNYSFINIAWTDEYLNEKNAIPLKDYYDKIDFTAPELVFNLS